MIAQDLHDGPLQELSGLTFYLTDIEQNAPDEATSQQAQAVHVSLVHLIHELRSYLSELRPPVLAPFGLEKAIRSYAAQFQQKHPELHLHLKLDPDQQRLNEETRLALFRIYQETLNNIIKHAGAREVHVRLSVKSQEIEFEIEDNGKGFLVPQEWVSLARQGHLGLVGIRERAESIGGQMQIWSRPGEGTRIQVRAPIDQIREDL